MVEYVVVQVASGPDVPGPQLLHVPGTLTAVLPGSTSATLRVGTLASTSLPNYGVAQVVSARLLPAWDDIRALALALGNEGPS